MVHTIKSFHYYVSRTRFPFQRVLSCIPIHVPERCCCPKWGPWHNPFSYAFSKAFRGMYESSLFLAKLNLDHSATISVRSILSRSRARECQNYIDHDLCRCATYAEVFFKTIRQTLGNSVYVDHLLYCLISFLTDSGDNWLSWYHTPVTAINAHCLPCLFQLNLLQFSSQNYCPDDGNM